MPVDPNLVDSATKAKSDATAEWYQRYYSKEGANRNNLRANPEVLFQTLAVEASVVRAFRLVQQDPKEARVLDVGCGGGGDLFQLFRMGYRPQNTTGIDIQADRIAEARVLYPQVQFIQGDATCMQFEDASFDFLFESTMFATLPDDAISSGIASEMLRVSCPGAYIMLVDWRTPKPNDPNYKALTGQRLNSLFHIGEATNLVGVSRGALVPPVGRRLSSRLPGMYFSIAAVFPFVVGQVTYVLKVI